MIVDYENLRLIDDELLKDVFKNYKCIEYILEKMLKGKLKVVSCDTFTTEGDTYGNALSFYICAIDEKETNYDIFIVKTKDTPFEKVLRKDCAIFDNIIIERNRHVLEKHKTVSIYLLENYYFKRGYQCLHISRQVEELEMEFDDDMYTVYFNLGNSEPIEDKELELLKNDLLCRNPFDIDSEILQNEVIKCKNEYIEAKKMDIESYYNYLRKELIEGLIKFSDGKVTEKEANVIANQHLRVTDFMDGSPLTHKGAHWLAKELLRAKNIID